MVAITFQNENLKVVNEEKKAENIHNIHYGSKNNDKHTKQQKN